MDTAKETLKFLKSTQSTTIQQNPDLKAQFNALVGKVKQQGEFSELKLLKLAIKVKEFAIQVQTLAGPKPALKKRDAKRAAKGSVKFSDKVEVHTWYERSWNDFKRKDLTKGSFTPQEVQTLIDSLCQYASQQPNPEEVLTMLCNKSKTELPKELYGAWPVIAECLPNRSV